MCCLNSGICQCNQSDNFCDVFTEYPTIRFAHKLFFICNCVISKKIVKIDIAAGKRRTVVKHVLRNTCQHTFFIKGKHCHCFCQGNLNSRICCITRAMRSSWFDVKLGEGLPSLSSACLTKSSAILPLNIGTALIGIAIIKCFFDYKVTQFPPSSQTKTYLVDY